MGNEGDDWMDGESGNDVVSGAGGDDEIRGGTGNDNLLGGAGADTLDGGAGTDRLRGDAGVDVFWFEMTGIDSDTILDFEVGERIEIHGDFDPSLVSITVDDRQVILQDLAGGESYDIRVVGAQESDVWLLPS